MAAAMKQNLSLKAQATKDALVKAAAKEFNTNGYFNTDTNRIARTAGYAPGTFYKYFQNKQQVFLSAYRNWVAAEWATIGGLKENQATTADMIAAVLAHHKKWKQFRADLRALAATDPEIKNLQNKLRRQQITRLAEFDPRFAPKDTDWSTQTFLFLMVERTCDAIADGSAKASRANEAALLSLLEQTIENLARGTA